MGTPALFRGKIVKVMPTKTFSTGSSSREFWAEEMSADKNQQHRPNVLAFEVFTSSKGPSKYSANCSDLDSLPPGTLVSFSYEARGNQWTNPKTNEERCFVRLSVVTKITGTGTAKVKNPAPDPAPAPDPVADDSFDMDSDNMPF